MADQVVEEQLADEDDLEVYSHVLLLICFYVIP